MKNWDKVGSWGLPIMGAFLGILIPSVYLLDRLIIALVCMCFGAMLAVTVPNLERQPQDDQPRTEGNERTLSRRGRLLHPINQPLMIGTLCLLVLFIVGVLAGRDFFQRNILLIELLYAAGIGLMGLLMIVRDENIIERKNKTVLIRGALSKVLGTINLVIACLLIFLYISSALGNW